MDRATLRLAIAKRLRGNVREKPWEQISPERQAFWLGLADDCLDTIDQGKLMNRMIERLEAIGAHAWLRFVQALNGIAVAVLGGILVVHQSYPQLIAQMLGPIPTPLKAATLFVFGVLVHYALRRAKKA